MTNYVNGIEGSERTIRFLRRDMTRSLLPQMTPRNSLRTSRLTHIRIQVFESM